MTALQVFGALILREHQRTGEIDDLLIQELAIKAGVLAWVIATRRCDVPKCYCNEAGFPRDCLRVVDPESVEASLRGIFS